MANEQDTGDIDTAKDLIEFNRYRKVGLSSIGKLPDPSAPGVGGFKYPQTLGSTGTTLRYVRFSAFKPNSLARALEGSIGSGRLDLPETFDDADYLGSVYLPIPEGIAAQHGTSYDTAEMAFSSASGVASGAVNAATSVVSRTVVDKIKSNVKNFGGSSGLDLTGVLESSQKVLGVSPNPNSELLFKGPSMRTHQFNYTLLPRNKAEADSINNIKNFFRYHQYPTMKGRFGTENFSAGFVVPSDFMITFHEHDGNFMKTLNWIFRSNLTSMAITENPMGQQSFITDESAPGWSYPVATSLQIGFAEGRQVTREDWVRVQNALGENF